MNQYSLTVVIAVAVVSCVSGAGLFRIIYSEAAERNESGKRQSVQGMVKDGQWTCAIANMHSQFGEDAVFLPWVLAAANGPGTFVELGALDGVTYSNTLMLERCFGWRGLLIEGQRHNFRGMMSNRHGRPNSRMVHSAVCKSPGFVNFTSKGGSAAGVPESLAPERAKHAERVMVPCKPLSYLMKDAELPERVNFLSLDVEGQEDIVLGTVNISRFDVVLVERQKRNPVKQQRVVDMITRSGMVLCSRVASKIGPNLLFVTRRLKPFKFRSGMVEKSGGC